MKRLALASTVLLFAQLHAQEVEWSAPVTGKPTSIFFHDFTQTPILETGKSWTGMDNENHKVAWSINKSAKNETLKKVSKVNALSGSKDNEVKGLIQEDYREIDGTQFAFVSGVIVDVVNGQAVVGSESTPCKLLQEDIIPSMNAVLFKVEIESKEMVYAVDLESDNVLWKTQLSEISKGKSLMKGFVATQTGDANTFTSPTRFVPGVDKNGNIIYANGKFLYLLNKSNGSVKWKNECNPGKFIIDKTGKFIYVVERVGALAISGAPLGKKMSCLFADNGNKRWSEPMKLEGSFTDLIELNDRQIVVATMTNIDVYDLASAKPVWKKPYSMPFFKSVENTKDGLLVYYGNKMNLINPVDGKPVWSKPVELEDVDNTISAQVRKDYNQTFAIFTNSKFVVFDKNTNKKKWSMGLSKGDRVAFDDVNGKALVISGKKIYVLTPDADAKKPAAVEAKLTAADELVGYQVSDNGYFIYGAKEFIMVSKDGKVLEQKVYPQLKTGRWANAAMIASEIGSGIMSARFVDGNGNATGGVFCDAETAEQSARAYDELVKQRHEMKANAKQKKAVRSSDNVAVFMTSQKANGQEQVALALVDKNTGKEIKTFQFSNDRDVVYEIDFNTNHVYFVEGGKLTSMKF